MFHGIPGGQPWRLTGHPRVLQLPSLVATAGLRRAIAGLLPPRCADAFDLRLDSHHQQVQYVTHQFQFIIKSSG